MRHLVNLLAVATLCVPFAPNLLAATWPGAPPCDGTLQACIDAEPSGGTVEIASDGPIDEDLTISNSLTLQPAPGFIPSFVDGRNVDIFNSDTLTAVVRGLSMGEDSRIWALQQGTGLMNVTIADNLFQNFDCNNESIAVQRAAAAGSVDYTIQGNTIQTGQGSNFCWAIHVYRLPGTLDSSVVDSGVISGNVISNDGLGPGGILVRNQEATLDLEMVDNRFSGSYPCSQVAFHQDGASSSSELLLANNSIRGNAGLDCGSLEEGLNIRINEGLADIAVVNNTVAHNDAGMIINALPSATLNGFAANNIVAFNQFRGLRIVGDGIANFDNDFNLVHENGSDTYAAGPNDLAMNPLFVAPNDLRLGPASPAIDEGDNARVPASLVTDLEGSPRIAGPFVDLGAFEFQDPAIIFADGFETGELSRWSSITP